MPSKILAVSKVIAIMRPLIPGTSGQMEPRRDQIPSDLVQRTNQAHPLPRWPDNVDHFALERKARELRSQYIADMLLRWWDYTLVALKDRVRAKRSAALTADRRS